VRLQLSSWPEIETYLGRSRGILVPIGSTEQHGPTGLLGTDAICPEVVAHQVGERIDALVAPTIPIGMAQQHLGFPGSISLRPTTLIAVIRDVVQSLARHGFERIYLLNGHGGNIATVSAAFSEVYADVSYGTAPSAPRCKLASWFAMPGVVKLSERLFGEMEGRHATPSEVSLSYYAHPDCVKLAPLAPEVAPTGTFRDALDYRRQFPDGRIGSNPRLATLEHGRRIWEVAVEDVIADYQAFMAEA
jgi:creatinine amidohydrolase